MLVIGKTKIKKIFQKSLNRAVIIVAVFAFSLVVYNPASTKAVTCTSQEDCQNKINTTTQSINVEKKQAQDLQDQIASFDNQIQKLNTQIQSTQNNINDLNTQIDSLNTQIDDTEKKLKSQKELLNSYLTVIYEESNISPLEMIAGSNSFSDFVDQSEYLQTMQQKVKDTVDSIKSLKANLEKHKNELNIKKSQVEASMKELSLSKRAVNDQMAAKNSALSATNAQIADLAKQRESLLQSFNGTTDYPFGNPPPGGAACNWDDGACKSDGHGYFQGQCTSYAAWWRRAHNDPGFPDGMGDAIDWGSNAATHGYKVDETPQVGDVMVFRSIAPHGHVAIVMSVNSDGTVNTSDYNWLYDAAYHTHVNVIPVEYDAVFIH